VRCPRSVTAVTESLGLGEAKPGWGNGAEQEEGVWLNFSFCLCFTLTGEALD